jgi:hypothetical protein
MYVWNVFFKSVKVKKVLRTMNRERFRDIRRFKKKEIEGGQGSTKSYTCRSCNGEPGPSALPCHQITKPVLGL